MQALAVDRPVPSRRRFSALARARGGSLMVETALLLPVLLTLVLGLIEVGHLLWTVAALNMAVEDAARCVSVSNVSAKNTQCSNQTSMQSYAAARTWGLTIPGTEFVLSQPGCGYEVSITHPFVPVISYIPLSFNVQASACFPQWQ
jgi:Flp pilus assembly protein TadG